MKFNWKTKSKKENDEYDRIYNNVSSLTCMVCGAEGSLEDGDSCYFCRACRTVVGKEDYEHWLNGGRIDMDYENGDYICDPTIYDEVYDTEGYEVRSECCGVPIKWQDDHYVCPECGQTIEREYFFNYIGAELPGELCLTCDQLYPCTSCHRGYVIEDKF